MADCCEKPVSAGSPPSHKGQLARVNRIRGQVAGIVRMINEGRYCPEIITQVQATRAALAALESTLLENHLQHCVREAFLSADERRKNRTIEEILELVRRS